MHFVVYCLSVVSYKKIGFFTSVKYLIPSSVLVLSESINLINLHGPQSDLIKLCLQPT